MTITATLAGAISMLAQFGLFFGGGNRRDNPLGGIGALLMVFLAPLAAAMVQMAVSRTREYEADKTGAEISGEPLALASALMKISNAAGRTVNVAAERNPAMAHLYIFNPLSGARMDNLFATHPAVENRIAALERLAGEMGGDDRGYPPASTPTFDEPTSSHRGWRVPQFTEGDDRRSRGPWGLSLAKSKDAPGLGLRLKAAGRLTQVLKGASFAPFTATDLADPRDRALANRLVTTALRHHGHLNLMLTHLLDRGMPKKSGSFEAVLRLSLAQLLYLPDLGDHSALFLAGEAMKRDNNAQHLAKLMNAVLRRAQTDAAELRRAPPELLFPPSLVKAWTAAYGPDVIPAFAQALLDGAPLDLTLKDDYPTLLELLGARPLLADTVRIDSRDKPVDQLPGYAEGRFWVQDIAAAMPARLMRLSPGARVLDVGAAPGGKTAQLIKAGYAVTALDHDRGRMERLTGNLLRLGYTADLVTADVLDYRPQTPFDGVLLDAPCSATGTFRRHPEVAWHRKPADIAGRVALQRRLIEAAIVCLNPGGVLLYCVCSLEPEEGEEQAKWILAQGLVAEPVSIAELDGWAEPITEAGYVRTHPGLSVPGEKGGTLDGFFVARFRRP